MSKSFLPPHLASPGGRGIRTVLAVALVVASAQAAHACVGDCNLDGKVPIDELVMGVGIALGQTALDQCPLLDRDDDAAVGVDELVAAVSSAIDGCVPESTPTVTPTASPTPLAEKSCDVPAGDGVNFDPDQPFCDLLSSYRFFSDGSRQIPNDGVLPYDLNTQLFSDYAVKHRFVWQPPGTHATYEERDSFEFPVGTVIIKTFAYHADARDPSLGERLIETRLIVHRDDGWEPITYVWNRDETEATKRIIGARCGEARPNNPCPDVVTFIDLAGETQTVHYEIPNTNKCRECHEEREDVFGPLGPKARNLNKDYPYESGTENQLAHWTAAGLLTGAPDPAEAPRAAVFDDPESGTLEERARTYLDVNCGNCHNPSGLARTSGLYLDIHETNPARLGICKTPVAAGPGSGDLHYDIVPGKPDESILIYRMESTEPGVAMPELGRQTVHAEGVSVLRDWISSLPGDCGTP